MPLDFEADQQQQAAGAASSINGVDMNRALVQVYSSVSSVPTVNNDGVDTAGLGTSFFVGSIWIKQSTNERWMCDAVTTGAAVWTSMSTPPSTVRNIPVVPKSGPYTVVAADAGKMILCDMTGGTYSVSLPPAATAGNSFTITVKYKSGSPGSSGLAVDASGAELIDNALTYAVASAATFVCDGTQWHVVSAF